MTYIVPIALLVGVPGIIFCVVSIKGKKEQKRREEEQRWIQEQYQVKDNLLNDIYENLSEKSKLYKWFAPVVADVMLVLHERGRDSSELISSYRRSETAWAKVNALLESERKLMERNAILRYELEYIKILLPEVENIIDFDEYKEKQIEADNPSNFLSTAEWSALSDTEKNKRALEYYKKRKKQNWEIGRDFELYIGYLFEREDYAVEYFGIEKKFEDLGRDLIVKDLFSTSVVQCKYWSREKTIHEKHIAQLYGTLAKYKFDNPHEENVTGLFVTHTALSKTAREFAKALGISVRENVELGEYPLIKCDNRTDIYGIRTKIYHLPIDQQYDIVKIDAKKGDCYAFTIEEAESMGYRRAYKWRGSG